MKTNQSPRLVAAFIICATSVIASAAPCGGLPVVTTTLNDGTKIGIVVKEAQFKKAPTWAPNKGEPPIPISKVIAAAEKWMKTEYAAYDSVRIHSVSLTEFGCGVDPTYWYYQVSFVPMKNGRPSLGGDFIAVLFDGTVIGPTKIP